MKLSKLAIASSLCISLAFGAYLASAGQSGGEAISGNTNASVSVQLASNDGRGNGSGPKLMGQSGKDKNGENKPCPSGTPAPTGTPNIPTAPQDEGC